MSRRPPTSSLAAALALTAAALLAVGCGSSGGPDRPADSSTTSSARSEAGTPAPQSRPAAPLAAAEYRRQAVQAISALGAFAQTLARVRASNLETLAPAFERQRGAFAGRLAAVRGLRPPVQLRAAHGELVRALAAVNAAMQRVARAARSDDRLAFLRADGAFLQAAQALAGAGQTLRRAGG